VDLKDKIRHQIELIENGKTLEAFERFFSDNVVMRNNDEVFASSKSEGMKIQAAFFATISEFTAEIYHSLVERDVSMIGVNYSYKDASKEQVSYAGIHKQKWQDGLIVTEDFYTGEHLSQPEFEKISNHPGKNPSSNT